MPVKIPVHLGDLSGPAGNVFAVVGQLQRSIKQCERAGITIPAEARAVADDYQQRTYDETIALIEEHYDDLDGSIEDLRNGGDDDWDE